MTKRRGRRGSYALALLAAAAFSPIAPASAQISSAGGPIAYSADTLSYADGRKELVLTGNVDLTQDDARLRADKLTMVFSKSASAAASGNGGLGSGDIERVLADGRVYYVRSDPQGGKQTAVGDHAVYEVSSDTVTFTGNVTVETPDNVIHGERLVLGIRSGTSSLAPGSGQRVQGVFRPRQGTPKPAAPGGSPQ